MATTNSNDSKGDNNINFQDINNSTINIGNHVLTTPATCLFVLTTIKKNLFEEAKIVIDSYDEQELQKWKPYEGESNIRDLLFEFVKDTPYKLDVFFVDDFKLNDKVEQQLHDACEYSIVIVDAFALMSENIYNINLASIFNNSKIGGFLPLNCELRASDTRKLAKKIKTYTFKQLWLEYKNRKGKVENIAFHLPNKYAFFRQLANMIIRVNHKKSKKGGVIDPTVLPDTVKEKIADTKQSASL